MMSIPRMRTAKEIIDMVKESDAKSALTINCVKNLCNGQYVKHIYSGRKLLIDLDDFLKFINYENKAI